MTTSRTIIVRYVSLVSLVLVPFGSRSLATTTLGAVGDGEPSLAYIAATGEMIIQPDRKPIGLFDLRSVSAAFAGPTSFPPFGLVTIETADNRGWGTLSINALLTDFSLAAITSAGLSQDFLLNDMTFVGNSGFGTPTLDFDLVYYAAGNSPPVGSDASLHFPQAGSGMTFTYQFAATDAQDPATALVWSNLQFSGDGAAIPQLQPTLTPAGLFTWDTTGSPRGTYMATALVTDLGGYADMAVLRIDTTPEPTSAALVAMAAAVVAAHASRFRRNGLSRQYPLAANTSIALTVR